MQDDQQQALASRPLLDEAHPDERAALEVEALARHAGRGSRPLPVRGHEGDEREGGGRVDDLHHAVALGPERRAQDAVARDDRVRCPLQPIGVEAAPHAKGAGEVVGGRERVDLVDEPQAPLEVAEKSRLALRPGRNPGRRGVPGSPEADGLLEPPGPVAAFGDRHGVFARPLGLGAGGSSGQDVRRGMSDPGGRRMRILEIETFGRGGLIHYAHNLSSALAGRGHDVTLLTAAAYELEGRALPEGVRLVKGIARFTGGGGRGLPGPLLAWARRVEAVRDAFAVTALARRERPDVVHLHCTNPAAAVYLALLRRAGVPLVATAHVVTPHERIPLQHAVYRRVHRAPDLVVAHSEFDRRRLVDEFSVPPGRIVVIPHGEYAGPAARRLARGAGSEASCAARGGRGPGAARRGTAPRARGAGKAPRRGGPARVRPVRRRRRVLRRRGRPRAAVSPREPVRGPVPGPGPRAPRRRHPRGRAPGASAGRRERATRLGDADLRGRLARGGRRIAEEHSWPAVAERTEAAFARLVGR